MGFLGILALSVAATSVNLDEPLKVNALTGESPAQFAKRTEWWREAKYGMFIHWGVYSVPADGEWHLNNHQMQVADYVKYAPQFNPVNYDPDKWVRVAKAAGMKYIVITSKHHDGFAMWDTKLSDWKITAATPFRRDPIKELSEACKKHGMKLCFYHSIMDWYHPDYLPRRSWEAQTRPAGNADLNRYIDFMKGQLKELLTNYGPIWGIWFDGGWEHSPVELRSEEVIKYIRELQPNLMINDRAMLPEDYSTPEQTIPAGAMPGGRLWETCMTLNNHWGYHRQDNNWKSVPDVVQKLCDIASKGGNFLLNVGPSDLGEIPQGSVDILTKAGKWLKKNGAAIYGTTKSPFRKVPFDGRVTRKGNTLYLCVFNWPKNDQFELPGIQNQPIGAKILGSNIDVAAVSKKGDNGTSTVVTAQREPTMADGLPVVIEVRFRGALKVDQVLPVLQPGFKNRYDLMAADATLHGTRAFVETIDGVPNIGGWLDLNDYVEWEVVLPKDADYIIRIDYACPPEQAGGTYMVSVANAEEKFTVTAKTASTGSWKIFRVVKTGAVFKLKKGLHKFTVRPVSFRDNALMNLRRLVLDPNKEEPEI